jgi:hypothetical protein
MFGKRHHLPSEEFIGWAFQSYRWLLECFGGFSAFRETLIVLPTHEHFPINRGDGHEFAVQVFDLVRAHARMQEWPCRLQTHEDPLDVSEILAGMPHHGAPVEGAAAGTFSVDPERREYVITYSVKQLLSAQSLIATFAHELAHALLSTAPTEQPGGEEAFEPVTDLGAVFLGFGVFLANSSFQFEQFQQGAMIGWGASGMGYLDEAQLSYALAICVSLLGADPEPIAVHLKTNPKVYMGTALEHIAIHHEEDLEALRRVPAGTESEQD